MAGGRWQATVAATAAAIGICFGEKDAPTPANPFRRSLEKPEIRTAEEVDFDSRIAWDAAFKAFRVKRKPKPKG